VRKLPEELKLEDVIEFSRTIPPQYAPKNAQYGMTIIHNYLRFFHEQGRLSVPLYFIRVPKSSSNSHHSITEEEYQKILSELNQIVPMPLQNICIIRMLNDTGMRVGELCTLDITDIGGEMSAVIKTEKTTKNRRVFWGKDTDALLKLFLSLRSELELRHDTKALFLGSRGNCMGRLTARSIQRMVKSITQRAGIEEKISPHSFRHGFIHRLAKKGVPDAVIALMVGHTTTHTISDYTKLSRTEMEETYRQVFSG
jgi:integrase/recombinase XerD